jgi:AAA15 family ATPase/GTPase
MLIQFTVGNFKSFKEKSTLSLEATPDDWLEEDNVATVGGQRLVKSAAIYGPNAGGKSNFLKGMGRFRDWILNSSKDAQSGEKIPVSPFRLSTETESAPTFFEAIFLQNGTRYRYGFEANPDKIVSEWLFSQKNSIRETRLFTRENSRIEVSDSFKEGKGLETRTRSNALFLSVAAQFNGEIAGEILKWTDRFRYISGLDDQNYLRFTATLLKDRDYARLINDLTKNADVGIETLKPIYLPAEDAVRNLPQDAPPELKHRLESGEVFAFTIKTQHLKFGQKGTTPIPVEFDLKQDESAGTQKFVALTGPVIQTLKNGYTVFVDELEARLHPLLTKALVGMFNSSANTKSAQLIFATHDEGLLDPNRIRRDQVWFAEKDDFGASRLYSLAEFKVRKEAKFGKEYLLGQFGAVPRVRDFEETLTHGQD